MSLHIGNYIRSVNTWTDAHIIDNNRYNFTKECENYFVDLVLSGHTHRKGEYVKDDYDSDNKVGSFNYHYQHGSKSKYFLSGNDLWSLSTFSADFYDGFLHFSYLASDKYNEFPNGTYHLTTSSLYEDDAYRFPR